MAEIKRVTTRTTLIERAGFILRRKTAGKSIDYYSFQRDSGKITANRNTMVITKKTADEKKLSEPEMVFNYFVEMLIKPVRDEIAAKNTEIYDLRRIQFKLEDAKIPGYGVWVEDI